MYHDPADQTPFRGSTPQKHSSPTNDLEQRDPQVLGDRGERHEEGPVVPPQAQESVAGMPRLLDDESNNNRELTDAESSVQPFMEPFASEDRAKLQPDVGRRWYYGTDDREVCGSIDDSVTARPG
jgi:hypothetical protein